MLRGDVNILPIEKSRLKIIVWVNDAKLTFKGYVVSQRHGFGISMRFTEMTNGVREQLQALSRPTRVFAESNREPSEVNLRGN
jgi:hypothetical protein